MKRITALALAAVVAFSLSGCTVFNTFISAGDEALLSTDLDALSDDLNAVPGIDAVDYDLVIQGDLSYTVSVMAFATDLSEDAAQQAFALVTSTFAGGRFPDQISLAFGIAPGIESSSAAIRVSSWLEFPVDVIPEEIEYLYDVQDAAGTPLTMILEGPGDLDVNYQRYISSHDLPPSIDWLAMRRVADTDAELTAFGFGSISMNGGIIPSEIEDVAAEVAAINGVALSWNAEYDLFDIAFTPAVDFAGNYTELIVWPDVVRLLKNASGGSNGFSLFGVTADHYGATVNGNDCGVSPKPTENDLELERILEAEGVIVEPGYC